MIFQACVFSVMVTFGTASAQSTQPSPVRYALLSAIGDQLTVVYAKMQTVARIAFNATNTAIERALPTLLGAAK